MTITILLAEDHQVLRQGLHVLLDSESDLQVVGEAADGIEALALLEKLQPQVLLLDLSLPRLHGLEVARRAAQRVPQTKVLILTMYADPSYIAEAFRYGVLGYVLKDSSAAIVTEAVRTVAEGRRFLSPTLSDRDVQLYLDKLRTPRRRRRTAVVAADDRPNSACGPGTQPCDIDEILTARESEVFRLAADGLTSGEVAARLSISPRTAEKHRANLMQKLGLGSQTELVRLALRVGIVGLDR